MRILPADTGSFSPEDLREGRIRLGWTERDVADRLLLSIAQVRALETGGTGPFHNLRFLERARDKFIALLKDSVVTPAAVSIPAETAESSELRLTFDDAAGS